MGIELTGCEDCDKTLAEKKDLCPKHQVEMISAQLSYWAKRLEEALEKEHENDTKRRN